MAPDSARPFLSGMTEDSECLLYEAQDKIGVQTHWRTVAAAVHLRYLELMVPTLEFEKRGGPRD